MQHVLTKDAILNLILRCQHFFYCRLACRKNSFFERRTTVFVCTVCLHQPSTQPHIKTTVIIQDHSRFDKNTTGLYSMHTSTLQNLSSSLGRGKHLHAKFKLNSRSRKDRHPEDQNQVDFFYKRLTAGRSGICWKSTSSAKNSTVQNKKYNYVIKITIFEYNMVVLYNKLYRSPRFICKLPHPRFISCNCLIKLKLSDKIG